MDSQAIKVEKYLDEKVDNAEKEFRKQKAFRDKTINLVNLVGKKCEECGDTKDLHRHHEDYTDYKNYRIQSKLGRNSSRIHRPLPYKSNLFQMW